MVLEPLLDRFISHPELESLRCIGVSCPLQIEIPERNRAGHGLRSTFFASNEVELIVDPPEVRDAVGRAVREYQLRAGGRLPREEEVGWRERDDRLRSRICRREILNEIAKGIEVMVSVERSRMQSIVRPVNKHSPVRRR